jgi:hypothetical protein
VLDLDMLVNREVDWTFFYEDNQVFASPPCTIRFAFWSDIRIML